MDIKWQRGVYLKFISSMRIRVGGSNALDIQSGDEFEYDGSILKYSGMEIPQPQLRGAVLSGWAKLAVEDGENDSSVDSIHPDRNIAKSKTVNRDLNKVQRAGSTKIVTSHQDEDEILRVGDRSSGSSPKLVTTEDNRRNKMNIKTDAADDQGAVAIGRVRTSAKQVFSDVSRQDASAKLNELENMSQVRADLFSKTIEKEGVTIKSNVGSVSRSHLAAEVEEGEVVAQVRNSHPSSSEGIEIRDTSRAGSSGKMKGTTTPAASTVVDFKTSPRLRIAKSFDPDFPADWSFEGKLADRLEAVKRHGATPTFLEALYAAEGDQMRKVLIKEFPDQFGT